MPRWPQGGLVLAILATALVLVAFYSARNAWIAGKIAALSAPVSRRVPCAAKESDRRRLYLIGDSSLARWPTEDLDAHWDVINCGVGGETAAQLARRFENFDFVRSQDVVLISSGGNDLGAAVFLDAAAAGQIVEKTTDGLIDLAKAASARSRLVLLATLIPPSRPSLARLAVWKESVRDFVFSANARLRKADRDGRIQIVDFAAALDSGDRRTPDVYRGDSVHLNAAGYARLTEAVNRLLPAP